MKKNKILGLIIGICVIIIILVLAIIKSLNTNEETPILKSERDEYLYYEENPAQIVNGRKPIRTRMFSIYYTVDECIRTYLTILKVNDSDAIYSYLNEDFIKEKGINKQNIFNILKKYNNNDSYFTIDMYELDGIKYFDYYIKGKIDNSYVYFAVGTDTNNGTFDITPIDEEKYNKFIETIAESNESKEKSIEKKVYNFFKKPGLSDEEICRYYYTNFIKLMLIDTEEAYKKINEEYRKEKFSNIDIFKQYVNTNRKHYETIYNVETADSSNYENHLDYYNYINSNSKYSMKSYAINSYDEYIQYVCGNITGSNFIFNAKYPQDYEVFMDSYTVCESTYTEKYSKTTDENKVAMNMERIRGALNNKDYKFAYNKLDETFRKNNFDTIEKYREFIEKTLFEYNTFDYKVVKKDGDLYIGQINVIDTTGEKKNERVFNIVMKLYEGTDFVMSFSLK